MAELSAAGRGIQCSPDQSVPRGRSNGSEDGLVDSGASSRDVGTDFIDTGSEQVISSGQDGDDFPQEGCESTEDSEDEDKPDSVEYDFKQIKVPQNKLEIIGNASMRGLYGLFVFFVLFSLIMQSLILSGVNSIYMQIRQNVSTSIDEFEKRTAFILSYVGITATISMCFVLFVVVAFPQRIIVGACLKGNGLVQIQPQQVVVIVTVFALLLMPEYSIQNVVSFWIGFPDGFNELLFTKAPQDFIVDNTSTLAFLLLYIYIRFWLLSVSSARTKGIADQLKAREERDAEREREKTRKRVLELLRNGAEAEGTADRSVNEQAHLFVGQNDDGLSKKALVTDHESDSVHACGASSNGQAPSPENDVEEGGAGEVKGFFHEQQVLWGKALEKKDRRPRLCREGGICGPGESLLGECSVQCSMYYACLCCLCCSKQRCLDRRTVRGSLWYSNSFVVMWTLILYYISFVLLSHASTLSFSPSVIPFVEIITVLRVCASRDSGGNLYCSYSAYRKSFKRAFASVFLFCFELWILFLYAKVARHVRTNMQLVPYAVNRANHLSYIFTVSLTVLVWSVVFFFAFVEVCALDVDSFILFIGSDPVHQNVTVSVDPLFRVGVTSDSAALAVATLLFAFETFVLAYAFLPSDSKGFKGWFIGSSKVPQVYGAAQNDDLIVGGDSSGAKKSACNCVWSAGKCCALGGKAKDHGPISRSRSGDSANTLTSIQATEQEEREVLVKMREYYSANPMFLPLERDFTKLLRREGHGLLKAVDGQVLPPFLESATQGAVRLSRKAATDDSDSGLAADRARRAIIMRSAFPETFANVSRSDSSGSSSSRNKPSRPALTKTAEATMALVLSHVFVLETELVQFNLAQVIYSLSTRTKAMSFEEERACIENPRLQLLKHIIDPESDTHAIIVLGPDRIYVAFRGTSSSVNVKTDLEYTLVPHERANSVSPLPSTMANDDDVAHIAAKRISDKHSQEAPLVHKGFLSTYETVSEEIFEQVSPYLFTSDGQQALPLFVTGHSLGGGLAAMCAFDLAVRIRDRCGAVETPDGEALGTGLLDLEAAAPIRVAYRKPLTEMSRMPVVHLTTWGCPRIGNYSFERRFRAVVPSAHRFVLASDVITKMPPSKLINSFRGYQHIGEAILLDLGGNLLINPRWIEETVLHRMMRPITTRHFMTRYCLALLLCYSRLGISEDLGFWSRSISKMCHFAEGEISELGNSSEQLVRGAYGVFFQDGVTFRFANTSFTTHVTQTIEPEVQVSSIVVESKEERLERELDQEEGHREDPNRARVLKAIKRYEQGQVNLSQSQVDRIMQALDEDSPKM